MAKCSRCETLPKDLPEQGVLYLAAPLTHLAGVLQGVLKEQGMELREEPSGLLVAKYDRKRLAAFCAVCESLDTEILQETRVLVTASDATPSLELLFEMQPLSSLVARIRNEWLIRLLEEGRLTTHFQPIVYCREPEKAFAYECLLRGLDENGETVSPSMMFSVARDANMLFFLDRAARISAIECAARAGITEKIFINFNPTSIYKPEYCLQTTFSAIKKTGLRHEQIVFEVVESERIKDAGHVVDLFHFYRENGYGVALDDVGTGYNSLDLLNKIKPEFMKADMEMVRDVHRDNVKAVILDNLFNMARQLGMRVIAEGVEQREEYLWLKEHGADFVQGFLFGEPDKERRPPKKI